METIDKGMVITLDPALKKLMEDLPEGDPDKKWVTVWVPMCEGKHLIHFGETVEVPFGPWYGPGMPITDVLFWYQYLGFVGNNCFYGGYPPYIKPFDDLTGIMRIEWP